MEAAEVLRLVAAEKRLLGEKCATTDLEQEAEFIESTLVTVHNSHAIPLRVTACFKRL